MYRFSFQEVELIKNEFTGRHLAAITLSAYGNCTQAIAANLGLDDLAVVSMLHDGKRAVRAVWEEVLRLHLHDRLSDEEIAEKVKTTPANVCAIIEKALGEI